jgi:hypothetical protein
MHIRVNANQPARQILHPDLRQFSLDLGTLRCDDILCLAHLSSVL